MELSSAIFSEFHFLRPWWLLALIPAAIFVLALWRVNSALSAWDKAIDKDLLPYLLDRSRNAAQRTPLMLLLCAWVLSTVALAGPVWEKLPQPVQQREDALVIVMDLSLSMFAQDHVPSRLDLAKRKLRDILALRDEGQTALVVYAGDAHAVMPLTDDVVTIEALVPSLSPNIMPLFGSNPMAAMDMAIELLDNVEASQGKILLMTDGISGFDQELLITRQLEDRPYDLLVMGIGTEQGAPIRTSDGNFLTDQQGAMVVPALNRSVLQSLANRVGGRYHDIQLSDSDLAYLLTDLNLLDDPQLSDVEEEFDVWYETGPWLLLLVAPMVALTFRRGWLFGWVLAAGVLSLVPAQDAQAAEWSALWQTPDQRGAQAFAAEDHAVAAGLFESPGWQGAASYRAENYDAAIAAYSALDTPDGHYNRGNALALSGNYLEAIAAYDLTLATDPEHEDAIFNKEIVEQLLEQQQSEQGESQEGNNESEQSDQNSDQQSEQDQENSEQQDQESQEGDENQQQDQQQNEAPEDQENSESNSEQNTPSQNSNEEFEEQQSLEQWLRRIEDDPGELLERKFRYQYRQRQLNGTANSLQDGGQIW
ncbi:MAG: VWA domain-containing protein [Gammaproteobacteria bacterium]|nr:VWA domain-containing protein [Gammaproteobacteria bacterium]MYA66133.1 VWA domain-containing protein [Gammaproteobacteria bacterium]MYC60044.1 VWA domain-containing protein [Gammaproteobacteria bacterium]MYG97284.1 VWA domain-containing protein [Gammaproteobacteria bacterium]MYH46169.1 VWA domain-containing protein [Gammaproteobacteria bacterium]